MPEPPPEPASAPATTEAALIQRIREVLSQTGPAPDLTDDCAHLTGHTALVTTDTLIEGCHFDLRRDTLRQVGAQAAIVNLSDLAASGGAAGWLLWSLILPDGFGADALAQLTAGFAQEAARVGARVVGGNLAHADGPLSISVTAGGPLAGRRPFPRSGAQPGDLVYLTGPIGDAALGYVDPDPAARAARHAWRPHLREARALALWDRVHAAMDISDGLLLDAHRLAIASGVALHLSSGVVPLGPLYRARRQDPELALRGGEDYVLLFTASPDDTPPQPCYAIGHVEAGAGLYVDAQKAAPAGYDHFAATPEGHR